MGRERRYEERAVGRLYPLCARYTRTVDARVCVFRARARDGDTRVYRRW